MVITYHVIKAKTLFLCFEVYLCLLFLCAVGTFKLTSTSKSNGVLRAIQGRYRDAFLLWFLENWKLKWTAFTWNSNNNVNTFLIGLMCACKQTKNLTDPKLLNGSMWFENCHLCSWALSYFDPIKQWLTDDTSIHSPNPFAILRFDMKSNRQEKSQFHFQNPFHAFKSPSW